MAKMVTNREKTNIALSGVLLKFAALSSRPSDYTKKNLSVKSGIFVLCKLKKVNRIHPCYQHF